MNKTENSLFSKFLIIWLGQLISNIGSGLTAFTLGVFVFERTHSATSYALIIFFSFLPSLLLKPVGGVLADRYNRRFMMIIGDLGSAFGLVFILIFICLDRWSLWQIYTGAAISSLFAALQNPAYKASVSDLLTPEMYAQASGFMQLATSSQFLVSPIIAGFLMNMMDIKFILIVDILTFLVAVFSVFGVGGKILTIQLEQHKKQSFLSEMKEGLQTILVNKGLTILVILIAILCFYIGFLQTLMGPMMLNFINPRQLGIVISLSATGLLFSSLLIGVFGGTKHHLKTVSLFLGCAGLFYAGIGFTTNIYIIIGSCFLFFFALPFVQTSLEVLIRQNVDNEKQGRVWAMISVITQLGYPLAYGLSGFLADYIFNPLLKTDGILAPSIGKIIGTGQGRGIGLMFILSGMLVLILAGMTSKIKIIKKLEQTSSFLSQ